jgi:hypothetical protein
MRRALRAKEILTVLCPLCGAKPGRKCQLGNGEARKVSHQDRRWAAKDREPEDEMWIRPRAALDSSMGEAEPGWNAWDIPATLDTNGSRYLQLANMALGMKKSE